MNNDCAACCGSLIVYRYYRSEQSETAWMNLNDLFVGDHNMVLSILDNNN